MSAHVNLNPVPDGVKRGRGRPKGSLNRETADIKAMVVGALNDVGGRKYLAARALDCPVAFMGLLGRILPLQVTGKDGEGLAIDFRWAEQAPSPPTIESEVVRQIEQKVEDMAASFENDNKELVFEPYSNEDRVFRRR
jgi:hypothetical protein